MFSSRNAQMSTKLFVHRIAFAPHPEVSILRIFCWFCTVFRQLGPSRGLNRIMRRWTSGLLWRVWDTEEVSEDAMGGKRQSGEENLTKDSPPKKASGTFSMRLGHHCSLFPVKTTPEQTEALFKSEVSQRGWRTKGVVAKKSFLCQRLKASFLYPFSYAPLGEGGAYYCILLANFFGWIGGFVCRQPPPANPFSKPLILEGSKNFSGGCVLWRVFLPL